MQIARRAAPDAAAAVAIGGLAWLFLGSSLPDYDAMYAVVWGEDIASGRSPQLELPFAPALHPLSVLAAAALSPLGDDAGHALRALVFLALGAAGVGLFRLGQELFGTAAGAIAAAVFATRSEALGIASQGFVDVPAAAFVVWAAVLEARRPVRGVPVAVLLALASLLRPELFLLAIAYVAWAWRHGSPVLARRVAAVAACAPIAWVVCDWVLSGEPLGALTRRNATLAEVGSRTGLPEAVETLARAEWGFIRPPLLVAAAAGAVWALIRYRQAMWLPLAVAALDVLAFLGLGLTGQPLEPRYLAPLSAMVALAAGVGLATAFRRPRSAVAAAAAVLVALTAVLDARRALDLREGVRLGAGLQEDLEELARQRAVDAAIGRAGGMRLPTPRPVPLLSAWTGTRPAGFALAPGELQLGALSFDAGQLLVRGIPDDDAEGPVAAPPPESATLAANGSWAVYRLGAP